MKISRILSAPAVLNFLPDRHAGPAPAKAGLPALKIPAKASAVL